LRAPGRTAVEIEFDVAFHDVDMVGVVWHGHYLKYLENARWALMNRIGYGLERMLESGTAWPVVEVQAKYVHPARFGDRLRARASLVEFETRMTVNYLLTRVPDGTRILRAQTVQAAVDGRSGELQFACPADFVECVRAAIAREGA
jgi:acyl-CoA thioester hydrolase